MAKDADPHSGKGETISVLGLGSPVQRLNNLAIRDARV
jgi:hypothetical protein